MLTQTQINETSVETLKSHVVEESLTQQFDYRGSYFPYVALVETRFDGTLRGYQVIYSKKRVKGITAGSLQTVVLSQGFMGKQLVK